MPNLTPITQKQVKVEVSGLLGIFWTSIKGGKLSQEEVKYNDGAEGLEKTLTGFSSIEPLTLSKPYDPVNDGAIQSFISAQRSARTPFNVTVTPVNADVAGSPVSGGKSITYSNCTFIGYNPPQFDRDGTGLAKCELMVAVNAIPSYGTA